MKDMTLTQEYLVCAVNEKGKIGSMDIEKVVCLLAAGLLELQLAECITMDKRRPPSLPRCRRTRSICVRSTTTSAAERAAASRWISCWKATPIRSAASRCAP